MIQDKITEDRDWRDGINAFRLQTREEILKLKKEIEQLKLIIKETQ